MATHHMVLLKVLFYICEREKKKKLHVRVLTTTRVTTQTSLFAFQSKELQLDIIPASAPGSEVKLRDAAHELNEEKRKSARRKE